MTIGATKGDVYTDFKGLAELRLNGAANREETLHAVGRQFEALFIQMMLKSMRDAAPGDPLLGSGGEDMYREMFDKQISLSLAAKGSLGLAEAMVRQLQQQAAAPPPAAPAREMALPPRRSSAIDGVTPSPAAASAIDAPARPAAERAAVARASFATPAEFVATLRPAAEAAARELGVDPRVLIAQAALETGWGRSVIQHGDGQSSHNLFNIKADGRWQGPSVNVATLEYRDGVAQKERAAFRAYGSFGESFADYVDFIKSQPRYREALAQAGDPARYLAALQDAGYATDPRYAAKIGAILERELPGGAPAGSTAAAGGPIA